MSCHCFVKNLLPSSLNKNFEDIFKNKFRGHFLKAILKTISILSLKIMANYYECQIYVRVFIYPCLILTCLIINIITLNYADKHDSNPCENRCIIESLEHQESLFIEVTSNSRHWFVLARKHVCMSQKHCYAYIMMTDTAKCNWNLSYNRKGNFDQSVLDTRFLQFFFK